MWEHDRKLHRATQHFEQLKAQVVGWEREGYTLRAVPSPDPPRYVLRADIERPVEDEPFPLILGDFLQNARAALDYLAGELGHIGGGGAMSEAEAVVTMFPITRTPEQFAQLVERRLPTVPRPVRTLIEDLQPYETGDDLWMWEPLWILNELARFDRHRFLHVGYAWTGLLELDSEKSRNVNISDLSATEGPLDFAIVDGLEETEIERAETGGAEEGAILATFRAEPINPSEEMRMEWKYAIEIGLSEDRLPATLSHLGGVFGTNVVFALRGIVPKIREVFQVLAPFLPAEPPSSALVAFHSRCGCGRCRSARSML